MNLNVDSLESGPVLSLSDGWFRGIQHKPNLLVQASRDPVSPEADSLVHRVLNVSKWGL